jgi:RNA polymerase sigma-70 factor (ECF subfamily)
MVRKQKGAIEYEKEMANLKDDPYEKSHMDKIIFAEVVAEIHRTLNVLPDECKKIYTMIYIQDKTVREVAEELQLSISTVKSQKRRGLAILREIYPQLTTSAVFEALSIFSLILIFFISTST